MKKKETVLMLAFAVVAITAMVVTLRVPGERGREDSGPDSRSSAETGLERALREDYLTLYARRKFAPLVARLGEKVTPEQRERLGAILAAREIAAGARVNGAALGDSDKRFREDLTRELGADVCAQVESYIRTLPQRLTVERINEILVYRGEPLSVPQIERLCLLMHQCEGSGGTAPTNLEWDAYVDQKRLAFQSIVSGAADFLTAKQIDTVQQEFDVQLAHLRTKRRSFESQRNSRSTHNGVDEKTPSA